MLHSSCLVCMAHIWITHCHPHLAHIQCSSCLVIPSALCRQPACIACPVVVGQVRLPYRSLTLYCGAPEQSWSWLARHVENSWDGIKNGWVAQAMLQLGTASWCAQLRMTGHVLMAATEWPVDGVTISLSHYHLNSQLCFIGMAYCGGCAAGWHSNVNLSDLWVDMTAD